MNSRIPRPTWRWPNGLEKNGEGSGSTAWGDSKNRGSGIIAGRPDYPRVAPINAPTFKTKNPPRRIEVFLLKTRGLPRSLMIGADPYLCVLFSIIVSNI